MSDIIQSEDICTLIVKVLKLIDRNIMGHSCRTAFILYAMLLSSGKYDDYEIAELTFVAALHDIGAFKVEKGIDKFKYEFERPMPHSIYGYLFMKNLSPYEHKSKIILYSHVDYKNLVNVNFDYKNVANMLNLAGMIDHFRLAKGKKFSQNDLRRHMGTKFSEEAFSLIDIATRKYDIFQKLDDGEYLDVLYEALKQVMFSDEDKLKMLELLIYAISFDEPKRASEAIICMDVAEQIAKRFENLSEEDEEKLHYAGLLHDIGMSLVSKEFRNPQLLKSEEDLKKYYRHLEVAEDLLRNNIDDEICDIVLKHHEKVDGSGSPNGISGPDMTMNEKIMQVANRVAEIAVSGEEGKIKPAGTIAAIITDEMNHNKFQRKIVMTFANDKEDIMKHASDRHNDIMASFNKINVQYAQLGEAMGLEREDA